MRKKLLFSMMLAVLSVTVAFAQAPRTVLFHEPFPAQEDRGLITSNHTENNTWVGGLYTFGDNADNWLINRTLGYEVFAITKLGGGSIENSTGAYPGASGACYSESRTWSRRSMAFNFVDSEKYRNVWFEAGVNDKPDGLVIEFGRSLGADWEQIEWTPADLEITEGTNGWKYVKFKKHLASVLNLQIRISTTAQSNQRAMDDLRITGERDYGYDLRKDIPAAVNMLRGVVEGLELGMYLSGSITTLESAIAAGNVVLAKGDDYTYQEALDASTGLTAAMDAFEKAQITANNAPKINQVADQATVFLADGATASVGLSGIAGTGTSAGTVTVTVTSLNGICSVPAGNLTVSGGNATLNYGRAAGKSGADVIIVKVSQTGQQANVVISKDREMRFAVEVLNPDTNYPPRLNNISNQYNVADAGGEKSVLVTGINAVNPGASIASAVVTEKGTSLLGGLAISAVAGGEATITFTPNALAQNVKAATAVVEVVLTSSNGEVKTEEFNVYIYNVANPPAMFDAPENAELIVGSGLTKLILPNVKGSDASTTFTVTVLENGHLFKNSPKVSYAAGRKFATLDFEDVGMDGTARVRVAAGNYVQEFDIEIKKFFNPGIELSLYDAMMWQQVNVIAEGASPLYTEVLNTESYPANTGAEFPNHNTSFWTGKWAGINEKWTIECTGGACTPAPVINLGTLAMKGFFIPEVSGLYEFSLKTNADFTVGLWFDVGLVSWKNAACIARATTATNPDRNVLVTGSFEEGDTRVVSAKFSLEAGKAYPMYSVRWFTHQMDWVIDYKGPGVTSWTTIPERMLSPLCDLVKPQAPTGVKIHTTLNEKILVEWNAAVWNLKTMPQEEQKVAKIVGYNVYANGIKNNAELIKGENRFLIEGLTSGTEYDVFVTSVDELGNESYVSNVDKTTTLTTSGTPAAPAGLRCEAKTGEVLKMRWNPNIAGGIVAYDVSVNGTEVAHVNNIDYIYTDSFFVRKLKPETKYQIRVRAYNGAMNVSPWSAPIEVETVDFDPLKTQEPGFNEHRVRLDINMRNISWTEGVGINGSFKDGSLFRNGGNNDFKKAIDDLKPGIVRWGALDANMYSLRRHANEYSVGDSIRYRSSIGAERKNRATENATHAMNMEYCNQIGAWYSLCVGTKDNGGWRVDYMHPQNGYREFQILLEYLVGPTTSIGGALRAGEGFAEPVLTKEKSKGLILEFGNEVWGETSHNSPIGSNYTTYGEWCRAMADSMRKSPYWHLAEDLILFKYSGRDPVVSTLNDNVVRGTTPGQIQILGVGGYLGGNLDYNPDVDYGESVSQYYRLRINHLATHLAGMQAVMKRQINMINVPLNTYFYETQVSTPSYYGNLGQATVLLDYITASMKYGSMVPAIFTYGSGEWMINVGNKPLAHYTMARLVNTYCKGHLVESTVVTNNQVMVDLVNINEFTAISNFDPVGASVYNNGNKWSILLFSRDFENEYSVSINLPSGIGTPTNIKRHIVTGDGSEDGPSIREEFRTIEDEVVPSLKSGDIVYVPPFSMVLYTFEANNPGFEKLPLGHFDRVLPQTIEFTGTPAITVNAGNTRITAVVTPADAFSTDVIWEISKDLNKEIVAADLPFPTMSPSGTSVTLRATGGSGANMTRACNGIFWLTATLADNPAVSRSLQVTLSNQASDCEYPKIGVDGAETGATVSVYPSLADEMLFVNTNTNDFSTVTIYSSIGIRIMAETSSEQVVEMNVASLPAGQYTAVVESNGKAESVTFLKK